MKKYSLIVFFINFLQTFNFTFASNNTFSLLDLPHDMKVKVISYLSSYEALQAAHVNRQWRQAVLASNIGYEFKHISLHEQMPTVAQYPFSRLSFDGCDLYEQDISELSQNPKLTHLSISHNKFSYSDSTKQESLAYGIYFVEGVRIKNPGVAIRQFAHSNLTSLELISMDIDDEDAIYIAQIKQLKHLDLSYNKIKDKSCKLITERLSQLTNLILDGNDKIGSTGASYLSQLSKLESLSLESCEVHNFEPFYQLKNLQHLNLKKNNFLQCAFHNLKSLKNLTSLNLYGCFIKKTGIEGISASMSLTNLDLGDNRLQDFDIEPLIHLTQLKALKLEHNQLTSTSVKTTISQLKYLVSLNLLGNELNQHSGPYLGQLIHLIYLNLNFSKLGAPGVQPLINLQYLESLYLDSNDIRDLGLQSICHLSSLKNLSLERNGITKKAMQHFSNLNQLKTLNLSFNDTGDDIVHALKASPKIISLNLKNTKLDKSGLKFLSLCSDMRYLDVSRNKLAKIALKSIGKLRSLRTLAIDYDPRQNIQEPDIQKFKQKYPKVVVTNHSSFY